MIFLHNWVHGQGIRISAMDVNMIHILQARLGISLDDFMIVRRKLISKQWAVNDGSIDLLFTPKGGKEIERLVKKWGDVPITIKMED